MKKRGLVIIGIFDFFTPNMLATHVAIPHQALHGKSIALTISIAGFADIAAVSPQWVPAAMRVQCAL